MHAVGRAEPVYSAFLFLRKDHVLPAAPDQPTTGKPPPPATPAAPPPPFTPAPTTTPPAPVTVNSKLAQLGTKQLKYDAQNLLVKVSYTDQQHPGYTVEFEGDKPVRLNFKGATNYLLFSYQGDEVVESMHYMERTL